MRINLALIASIIFAVGLVAFLFTAFQISSERQQLKNDLRTKTASIADEFYKNHLSSLEYTDSLYTSINDTIIKQYSLNGIAIYYNADSIVPFNKNAAV